MVDLGQKRQVNSCLFYWNKFKCQSIFNLIQKLVLPLNIGVSHLNSAFQQLFR